MTVRAITYGVDAHGGGTGRKESFKVVLQDERECCYSPFTLHYLALPCHSSCWMTKHTVNTESLKGLADKCLADTSAYIFMDMAGCCVKVPLLAAGGRRNRIRFYANARGVSSLGMHIKRSRSGRWRTRDSLGRSLPDRCTTPIHSHERVNCRRDVDLRPHSADPPR